MRVVTAYDGEAAARLAHDARIDVLVCDLDMPKRTGLEVLESLAAADVAPTTVVISGYLDRHIEARLYELPFVRAVMRKPFDLFVFGDCVRDLAAGGRPRVGREGVEREGVEREGVEPEGGAAGAG